MFKNFVKTLCVVAAVSAIPGTVSAKEENARIKKASFSITVPYKSEIDVTSSDGREWDTIVPNTFPLWVNAVVDTKGSGYVEQAGIFLGHCTGNGCATHPLLFRSIRMERDMHHHDDFDFDTSKIPTGDGLRDVNVDKDIFGACNAHLQPDGATESSTTRVQIELSLSVNTRKAASMNWAIGPEGGSGFNGGDVTRHTAFIVQVNCKEFQKIEALPEPYSVDVKVEQSGNSCPKKTDVTALIKYRKPMTATFRFKVDGKPSEPITIKARKVEAGKPGAPGGPGAGTYYLIERLKTYHLDPGQHNFRVVLDSGEGAKSGVKTVKIDCPLFKVVSTSLDYKVAKQSTCPKNVKETVTATATRPGKAAFVIKTAGGLVVHSGTAVFKRKGMKYAATIKRHNLMMSEFDSDMMADFTDYAANSGWVHLQVACLEALTGKLTLNSLGTTSCQGEALVAIHTNGTGKLPYELECGPGKSWKRKVTAMDNKIGVDKVRFDVTNHEQVTCVLRTRIDGKLKPIDGASKTFQCHRPTDAGATNDFVPETRPDAQGAHNPDKVVIDPPRLPNGPRQPDEVVIDPPRLPNGPRQPDEVVIDPPRSPSNPTSDDAVVTGGKTEMSCSGGTVRNGECLCPRTHKAVSAGTNAFRCVKSVVIDPVKPGGKQVDSTPDQGKSGAKDSGITDATPDYPKKTRADAEADRKRLEALKKKREEEARKKAEAERKRKEAAKKAAEARSKREAAKKAAEARRKQESAKKAAEARRKREAAKKAAEARRKRQEAQKKAQAAQKKRAEMAKKAEQRRKNGGSKSTPAR